jgi:hypothetical protein
VIGLRNIANAVRLDCSPTHEQTRILNEGSFKLLKRVGWRVWLPMAVMFVILTTPLREILVRIMHLTPERCRSSFRGWGRALVARSQVKGKGRPNNLSRAHLRANRSFGLRHPYEVDIVES